MAWRLRATPHLARVWSAGVPVGGPGALVRRGIPLGRLARVRFVPALLRTLCGSAPQRAVSRYA